uniref:Uncharacterized protein n=1 Tax=Anguilla anguilla TaxID=7936 RepID=A0A0E9Q697_ANGAN
MVNSLNTETQMHVSASLRNKGIVFAVTFLQ